MLQVLPDAEAASEFTAERLLMICESAVASRGRADLALAGGNTPKRAYELFADGLSNELSGKIHLWFGDERCVPYDSPDSNYLMVKNSLLEHCEIPAANVHPVETELPPPEAAQAYERLFKELLPIEGGLPRLDCAMLGVGEDGHTASLFPGGAVLDATDILAAAVVGSKPPPHRITLTIPLLAAARCRIFLSTGAGKLGANEAIVAGPDRAIPASLLYGANSELVTDPAGAPGN